MEISHKLCDRMMMYFQIIFLDATQICCMSQGRIPITFIPLVIEFYEVYSVLCTSLTLVILYVVDFW